MIIFHAEILFISISVTDCLGHAAECIKLRNFIAKLFLYLARADCPFSDNFFITWVLFNSAECDKLNVFITEPGKQKSLKQFYDNWLIADVLFVINSLFIRKSNNQTRITKPDGHPWKISWAKIIRSLIYAKKYFPNLWSFTVYIHDLLSVHFWNRPFEIYFFKSDLFYL